MGESNRLTTKFIEQVKTAGVYRDGAGLFLRVEPTGSKRWVLRTTVKGRRRDVGLGSALNVSLREARDEAGALRKLARAGEDPAAKRRQERSGLVTFEAAAEAVHSQRADLWRNAKHGAQWIASLRAYAFPLIGKIPIGKVESADVLRVLAPIWLTKPETARRVRQRIRTVLDWAVAAGHRPHLSVNAADAVRAGLPKQPSGQQHHRAIPWDKVPTFVDRVRATASFESVRFALEFLILTAARTGEVVYATWPEIDFDSATWTVPAARMKAKREHRVPVSRPALQILNECRALWPNSKFVFPGRHDGSPLSNMSLLMLMRRLGCKEVPHGLRSSFRDWAAYNRKDRDLAEAALAHALPDRTEAAYRRSDLFELRRVLMEEWGSFVGQEQVANV
jgi:integrase